MTEDKEDQFTACLFVVGPPLTRVRDVPDYGISSSLKYRSECSYWFHTNDIPGEFLKGEQPGAGMGRGWWVEYKQWLYEHTRNSTSEQEY